VGTESSLKKISLASDIRPIFQINKRPSKNIFGLKGIICNDYFGIFWWFDKNFKRIES
jgi:hypothetical protein